jgi:hemerythrin-like metal-binding protein
MISEWNYVSVGVENVDERNRVVIEKLVNSFRRLSNGVETEQRDQILDRLITDLFFHFEGEAVTMQQSAYPEFLQHDKDHKRFTSRVVDLYKQLRQGWITPWEMLSHLFDGLCLHIVKFDSKYANYLRARNRNDCEFVSSMGGTAGNPFD